jgi:hypothetical protein
MRRSWIKIETNTPDKPEVCIIASQLRMDSDAVMGKLVRLWAWAELNVSGNNDTSVTPEFLDKVVGKKGFSAALIKAGWLKEMEDRLEFPNFSRHNGREAKGRAQTALRVSRHRAQKAKVVVTPETVEALDEESAISLTTADPSPPAEANEEAVIASNHVEVMDADQVCEEAMSHLENEIEPASEEELVQIEPAKEVSIHEATALIAETLASEEMSQPIKKRPARPSNDTEEQPLLF